MDIDGLDGLMGCLVEDSPTHAASPQMPEVVLEWFPTGTGDPCDITEYLTGWGWSSGRERELDRFTAGSGSVRLEQTKKQTPIRLFDRENTAGPFYGWLRPLRQVRLSASWAGTRYPVWHGYLTDLGHTVEQEGLFESTWEIRDATAIFEQIILPSSWYELAVAFDNPTHWWRLNEPNIAGAVPIDVASDAAVGFYDSGVPILGESAIVPFDGGRSSTTWDGAWINLPDYAPSAGDTGFSVEGWFKLEEADLPATSSVYPLWWFGQFDDSGVALSRIQLSVNGTSAAAPGELAASFTTSSGVNTALSGVAVNDGETHHFVVTLPATGGTVSLFLDGELVDTDASVHSDDWELVSAGTITTRGAIGTGYFVSGRLTFPGTQSHLVVWHDRLHDATTVATHYAAGATGFAGDTTGERIGRILDYIGWSAQLRDIDTGVAELGGYDLSGQSVDDYLNTIAQTELGALFIDGENRVVFHSRDYQILDSRATTPQAVIGDTHAAGTDGFFDADNFDLGVDFDLIRNPVTASRDGGISVTVEDTALSDDETGYGRRSWSAPVSLESLDTAIAGRARRILNRYKQPLTRLRSGQLTPTGSTDLWPVVLGAQFEDRWTILRTPGGVGGETSVDQLVEKLSHSGTPFAWTVGVVGAPVDDTDYLIVGVGFVGVGRVA